MTVPPPFAVEFGEFADGCVVGSKIVKEIANGGVSAMAKCVKELSGGPLKLPAGSAGKSYNRVSPSAKVPAGRKKHADKWNFGQSVFGGRFIPETLMVAHKELEAAWNKWKVDPAFKAELATLRREFIGLLNESDWVYVRGWQPSPWGAVEALLPEWPGALCLSNCALDSAALKRRLARGGAGGAVGEERLFSEGGHGVLSGVVSGGEWIARERRRDVGASATSE